VFITRERREAAKQKALFETRLNMGHKLLFFPEGTSSDGLRVLGFKPTLFAAFFTEELKETLCIQPITVVYHAPKGEDPRFYGWWSDMDFGSSLLTILGHARQGRAEVTFHEPVEMSAATDRKALAAQCEAIVRSAMPQTPSKYLQ